MPKPSAEEIAARRAEAAARKALKEEQQATVEDTELEDEYGRLIYQVDLRDAQGQEWDLELDATSGEILREERDD